MAIAERVRQRRERNNGRVTHTEPTPFHGNAFIRIDIEIVKFEAPGRNLALFRVTVGERSLFDPVMIFRQASDASPVKKELLVGTYIDPCVITPASVLTFSSNRSDSDRRSDPQNGHDRSPRACRGPR